MRKRVSIYDGQPEPEDVWSYYQETRDSIVQAATATKRALIGGAAMADPRFQLMNIEEIDAFYGELLDETDAHACLFLIASAEAALRIDFLRRVYKRGRDTVSKEFRQIYAAKEREMRNVRLDADILAVWTADKPRVQRYVNEFAGALNYRHWLAHGRYWVPKLGKRYDPSGIQQIVTSLFAEIGLLRR